MSQVTAVNHWLEAIDVTNANKLQWLILIVHQREFFNAINRGGLWKPTPEIFNVGCLCWTIFAELCQEQMRETFLSGLNQRKVFNEIVSMAFYEGKIIFPWSVSAMCNKDHNILEGISIRFFNCMGKNLLREMNELAATKAVKKIRKMAGKNATN